MLCKCSSRFYVTSSSCNVYLTIPLNWWSPVFPNQILDFNCVFCLIFCLLVWFWSCFHFFCLVFLNLLKTVIYYHILSCILHTDTIFIMHSTHWYRIYHAKYTLVYNLHPFSDHLNNLLQYVIFIPLFFLVKRLNNRAWSVKRLTRKTIV